MKKTKKGISNCLRERDSFGQPVVLNYKGSDTFKTHIGGVLSLVYTAFILGFLVIKGQNIMRNDNLEIEKQTMILEDEELKKEFDLGDYNETLQVGFEYRGQLNITEEEYKKYVRTIDKSTLTVEMGYWRNASKFYIEA